MDTESPASPGATDDVLEPGECSSDVPMVDGDDVLIAAKLPDQTVIEGSSSKRSYGTPQWNQKYKRVRVVLEQFQRMASLGDTTAIYRNRPVWIGYSASDLIEVAMNVLQSAPSSLPAVLNYTGLLIHENAHLFFSSKENPNLAVDYSSVQNAVIALLKQATIIMDSCSNTSALDVLSWCCTVASELSQQNSGRPFAANARGPEQLLELFTSCISIKELISLLDLTVTRLLMCCPDECMTVLFDASRHGSHFNWIWLHIAVTFPGSIVDHLFTVGAEQFTAYVEDIQNKEKNQVAPAILAAIHDDYNVRFMSLSEMFNFLMRRGNIELKNIVSKMILESLDADIKDGRYSSLNVIFFFKLVTCSVDTLRFLITHNNKFATPLNFYRGMRQILSVDKRLILPLASYQDFGRQMLHALDMETQNLVFSVMANIAFGHIIPESGDTGEKDVAVNKIIKDGAVFAVDELVSLVLRTAHSSNTVNVIEYPPIGSFAAGAKLQFLINAASTDKTRAPIIIRYLHALCIALGELKGAEIVIRFLLSVDDGMDLAIVCAFLSSITPFFPELLGLVYANLSGIRQMYIEETSSTIPEHDTNFRLLNNVRILLEWEVTVDNTSPLYYYGLNPASHVGELLVELLAVVSESVYVAVKDKDFHRTQKFLNVVSRLLRVFAPPKAAQSGNAQMLQMRNVLMSGRYAYKSARQLAALLKFALSSISREFEQGVSMAEELRSAVFYFYGELCSSHLESFANLFLQTFLTDCLYSNSDLFGEKVCLDQWKDPEPVPKNEEETKNDDDYSFLDALEKMTVNKKAVHLAHSGTLRKGAKRTQNVSGTTEDQSLRSHVFLDIVHRSCLAQSARTKLLLTKVVATSMLDMVCQDALSQDFVFQDWDLERENISRYLEVVQRLNASWVCRGLLNTLAEVPLCSWFCFPIIKAQLAVILYRFESATNKTIPPSTELIDELDRWMLLVRKADMLLDRFDVLMDIIPSVSYHEGYLLLMEVWVYYQKRAVSPEMVEKAFDDAVSNSDTTDALKDAVEVDFTMFRLVIQQHILELGHVYPVLFEKEMRDGETGEQMIVIE